MKKILKWPVTFILTLEAKLLLWRKKPKIIAVVGSVGKTSTKDAIYAVLKDTVKVRRSSKSYNSDIGVPLTVLGLKSGWDKPLSWLKNILSGLTKALFANHYPEVLILELGVDRPGDMKKLTAWIKPDIVVLTRLPEVPVHVEFFATPEDVIAEKLLILEALKVDGKLVFNRDDERVREAALETRQKSISYSRYSFSDFTAAGDTILYDGGVPLGTEFNLTHNNQAVLTIINGTLGVQHAYVAAAAAAVGSLFDISLEVVSERLKLHRPPPGRMRIIDGLKNTLIIDDTYNSSPVAARRALQTLKEITGFKRKIVVFGDVMELGEYSDDEHQKLGEMVAGIADGLFTIGERSHQVAARALECGLSEKMIWQYDNSRQAGKDLELFLNEEDIVLVKGSQSIRAEEVVKEVMAEPEKAEELLVRQEQVWQ